jgi:hypothetical protein
MLIAAGLLSLVASFMFVEYYLSTDVTQGVVSSTTGHPSFGFISVSGRTHVTLALSNGERERILVPHVVHGLVQPGDVVSLVRGRWSGFVYSLERGTETPEVDWSVATDVRWLGLGLLWLIALSGIRRDVVGQALFAMCWFSMLAVVMSIVPIV